MDSLCRMPYAVCRTLWNSIKNFKFLPTNTLEESLVRNVNSFLCVDALEAALDFHITEP